MLVEKLSAKDLQLFENYTNCFGPNQDAETYRASASPEYLLQHWDAAKSDYLWYLMGEQFILEREVSYTEPEATRRDKIATSCTYGKMQHFFHLISKKMGVLFPDYYSDEAKTFRTLTDFRNLAINKLDNIFVYKTPLNVTIDLGDGHKVKVDENTKPMRALGKLANFLDLSKEFEEFRLEHSLILNQKKLSGTLCLSIHPMDYVTLSDNNSGWTSCMNWHEPGSYRMGTVEMMNSNKVIVAYLKSEEKDFTWYSGKWNNKHWRILIVVTPEGVVSIKGYPFYHADLVKECVQWILDLGAKNLSWNFDKVVEVPDQKPFEYVDGNWYRMDSITKYMYNDFSCSTHWGAFPKQVEGISTKTSPIEVFFEYSGPSQCMCCGEPLGRYNIYDESYVYCENCTSRGDEDQEYCAHCGEYWHRDDMYWVQDDYICPDCLDDVAVECALTREYIYNDSAIKIYLAATTDKPEEGNDEYIWVNNCYATRWSLADDTGNRISIAHPRANEDDIYYLNREDINEDGMLRYFGIPSKGLDEYFNRRDPFEE
jgi:hypothetical protein